jgi:FkbM family methyltransferase
MTDLELVDFSECGQPTALLRYLPPEVPRFLVDVGAYDGVQGSNSRQLLLDGWTGVLIEPVPAIFERLSKNCRDLRNVHLFQCAAADRDGVAEMSYSTGNETGQCASLFIHDSNDARMRVEVATLNTILTKVHAPKQFGLLLIDAEGGDLEVLHGIDFAQHRPAVILTEDFTPKNPAKRRFLEEAGYDYRMKVGADSIWTSRTLVGDEVWPEQSPSQVYAISPPPSERSDGPGVVCVDEINDECTFVWGWAHVGVDKPVPGFVALVIDLANGSQLCFRGFRCPRLDVAEHHHSDNLLMSGFKIYMPGGINKGQVLNARLFQSDHGRCYFSANCIT